MTRTAPPQQKAEEPPAFVLTQAPVQAPPTAPVPPSPVAFWPSPLTDQTTTDEPAKKRRSTAGRGLPMGPTLVGASNSAALTVTAAYSAGGPVAAAATGAIVAASATAMAVRRRATTRRSMASRGGSRGALGGGPHGALASGRGGFGGATKSPSRGATGSVAAGAMAPHKTRPSGSGSGSHGATGGNSPAARAGKRGGAGGLFGGASKGRHAAAGATGRHATTGPHNTRGVTDGKRHGSHATKTSGATKSGTSATRSGLKAAVGRTARALHGTAQPDSKTRKTLAAVGTSTQAAGRGAATSSKFLGKHAKNGWNASAPARAKALTAAARAAKKAAGAATDGTVATIAAAWTGLWKRDRKATLDRLRDVWNRLRARRAHKAADKNAKNADATPETPPVAESVRRPTSTSTPRTASTNGGTMSGGHHFIAPAMEGARIAANYDPQGMLDVGADFAGLAEALRLHAEGMKVTTENADAKWPLDPNIIEIMRQVHELQLRAATLADELKPAFEKLHDVDLDRLRNPRKGAVGEAMWDVTRNL